MTSMQQKPLNLPANREDRIARALELEDGCVLAGGNTQVQGCGHGAGLNL